MRRAGVGLVAFGLESASEKVLKGLKKGLSLSRLREAVALVQQQGMDVELFSQYGLPNESIEDAEKTLEFVQSCVPVQGNTNAQQMRLYFGAPFQDKYEEYGIHPLEQERPPYLSIGSRYETDWMSAQEIHVVAGMWKNASVDGGKRMVS